MHNDLIIKCLKSFETLNKDLIEEFQKHSINTLNTIQGTQEEIIKYDTEIYLEGYLNWRQLKIHMF